MANVDLIDDVGSVTRARPGDENAPERISDFGPADVDRLIEERTEQMNDQSGGDSVMSPAVLAGLAVVALALARSG